MKKKKKWPPKWTDKYPHGTPEGDEEIKFFESLGRKDMVWRRTSSIATETGLSKKRVEEIIFKYLKMGMIFQSDHSDDQWAYWERIPERVPSYMPTVCEKDQEDRINKYKNFADSE